jgi:hypothetical protein
VLLNANLGGACTEFVLPNRSAVTAKIAVSLMGANFRQFGIFNGVRWGSWENAWGIWNALGISVYDSFLPPKESLRSWVQPAGKIYELRLDNLITAPVSAGASDPLADLRKLYSELFTQPPKWKIGGDSAETKKRTSAYFHDTTYPSQGVLSLSRLSGKWRNWSGGV